MLKPIDTQMNRVVRIEYSLENIAILKDRVSIKSIVSIGAISSGVLRRVRPME